MTVEGSPANAITRASRVDAGEDNPRQFGQSTFRPNLKQLAYLFAVREAVIPGSGDGLTSDLALSKKLRISRQTIWEWKHDPEFIAWWTREMIGAEEVDWRIVIDKQTQLAIRGSVRSAEFLARVRSIGVTGGGFTDQGGDTDKSVSSYQVILLSPRPAAGLPPIGGRS